MILSTRKEDNMSLEKATPTQLPVYVYKYMGIESAKCSLKNSSLKVSPVGKFNDPFECMPGEIIQSSLEDAISLVKQMRITPEELRKFYESDVQNRICLRDKNVENNIDNLTRYFCERLLERKIEITSAERNSMTKSTYCLCFSEAKDNILMWSNYAENHKGVVLIFSTENFTELKWFKIKYQKDRAKISYPVPLDDEIHNLITTKYDVWAYEKELRLLFPVDHKRIEKYTNNNFAVWNFPIENLHGIIYGENNNDYDTFKPLISKYPNIKEYKASIHKTGYEVEINPKN